jgi:hypothetical protein
MKPETKLVRTKGSDADQTINAEDFDPAIHTEVTAKDAPAPSNIGGTYAKPGPKLVNESSDDLAEMSKAERKEELSSKNKEELRGLAEQHDVHTDKSMNKSEIASALNKQLDKEAKTGTR